MTMRRRKLDPLKAQHQLARDHRTVKVTLMPRFTWATESCEVEGCRDCDHSTRVPSKGLDEAMTERHDCESYHARMGFTQTRAERIARARRGASL